MQMIRQHDPGVDMEGMACQRRSNGAAQRIDFHNQQIGAAIAQIDGEEIASAREAVAAIVGDRLSPWTLRGERLAW
jgi:hypothetical protein